MADGRAEKIAAARKKLKAFQGKSTKVTIPDKSTGANKQLDSNEVNVIANNDDSISRQGKVDFCSEPVNNSSASKDIHEQKSKISLSPESAAKKPTSSSSESLRQISMQLNGLVSQTQDFVNGTNTTSDNEVTLQLEKRNQELASLLETHKQSNGELTHQLQELKLQIAKLQEQLKKERQEFEEKQYKEQGTLHEQLQIHIQTIGILVAEKTELQSSLAQYQQTAKQKAGEVEELQGRLKASRQRVSDMERELATTTVSSQQLEKSNKQNSKEVDRLKMDIYKTTKLNEELEQRNSELQEKLNVKLMECKSQEERIEDLQNRLTMTELRVKQLSSGNGDDHLDQLEEMQKEKVELERILAQVKDGLQKTTEDRDQVAENYQKFAHQLNQQIHGLNQRVTSLNDENETLKQHNNSLNEKILQMLAQIEESDKTSEQRHTTEKELGALDEKIKEMEKRESELQRLYQTQIADNSQLGRLLEEREMRIEELESSLTEAQNAQMDKGKLLEAMQSDKVAASRAVAQNKELKKQLEELQNGFVKMSNDKLNLTEGLQEEQHISKELGERLSQQEEELNEMRDQLSDKERRLSLVQKSSTELTKQMYQQHQLADRVRHFEAQGQLTEMIQQELNQAQERISALTAQNSELRMMLANQAESLLKSSDGEGGLNYDDKDSFRKDEMVVSLSASVRQLELERNQLLKQLEDQQQQRETLKAQLIEMNEVHQNEANDTILNGEADENDPTTVSLTEYRNLKQAMAKLEDRFKKTMNGIAELSDEKQQLEYLVMQLQGETETIGDYIALYQMQRSVMKQQVTKKDEYIALVCQDREELKVKLSELQDLVYKLLYEKEQLQEKSKLPGKARLTNIEDPQKLLKTKHINGPQEDVNNHHQKSGNTQLTPTDVKDNPLNGRPAEPSTNPAKTARKIIDLISEIGSTALMEKSVPDNFHPCPVCSGQLITV